jgi:hypothetical protein
MSKSINAPELAGLLTEAGSRHHAAYKAANGVDPEWASWYAPFLQARLADRLGSLPTRSDLVYLLVAAERAFQGSPGEQWADFYAAFILDHYAFDEAG